MLSLKHRPYPVPSHSWLMFMRWENLLFAHWRVDPNLLRPFIPSALELETFDGSAWIGVVPFEMKKVHLRGLPGVPTATNFLELNVRTYVRLGDKQGVWFFSLDATSQLAVCGARISFHLPYFEADLQIKVSEDKYHYIGRRTKSSVPGAELDLVYGPSGSQFLSKAGSLDAWLTERYCLYSADKKGRVFRGDIHHAQWPLQPAWCSIAKCDMTRLLGFELDSNPATLHFAKKLDVIAWKLERCSSS